MKVRYVFTAALLVMAPAPALAATSYQGADYSYDSSSKSALNVCDMEADGQGVKGEAYNSYGSKYTINDGNGSTSGCGFGGSMGLITRHHTCETKGPLWPDDCGAWAYP